MHSLLKNNKSEIAVEMNDGSINRMRSDLNMLANNFDVVSYDFKDLESRVDINQIITWCDEEYQVIIDISFEEEYDDQKTKAISLSFINYIANRFHVSLKPVIKKIVNKIEEVSDEVEIIDLIEQITTEIASFEIKINNKFND